jgi:hypothetical protein
MRTDDQTENPRKEKDTKTVANHKVTAGQGKA